MREARLDCCLVLICASLAVGCNSKPSVVCPAIDVFEADPSKIPPGESTSIITTLASDPQAAGDPDGGRSIATILTSPGGTFDDATAETTTFTCDPYENGPVEVCVEARYDDGSAGEADGNLISRLGDTNIAATYEYLRRPHAYLEDPDACVTTKCITVTCAENICPIIERMESVPGSTEGEVGTSTIFVDVRDPDGKPEPLEVTLWAEAGTFDDRYSSESKYRCDLARTGEPLDICVLASDGDESCDQTKCIEVECNVCPNLNILNAIPSAIPDPNKMKIEWRAIDPDTGPEPLAGQLTSTSGSFDDPTSPDSVFTCDTPGEAEICVEVTDSICVKQLCIVVFCPGP